MSDEKSSSDGFYRWSWDVAGFEPRLSPTEHDDHHSLTPPAPLVRRHSISPSSISSYSELSKHAKSSGLLRLKNKIKLVREDYAELRQEASDLQEYCNAKLDRVTRYLGVLADKTRRLDQAALDTEARISPLISEKKRLFNKLLTTKGNVQVFCRVRPLFEDEGSSVVEYPDSFTVRVNTGDDSSSNPKKDFEFDRVYGPHVGQADLFNDIQPFVQSAFDGFNVCIFAYGQTHSGKTHTMEGSSHDRGLYARCFEELFDLSNSDATSTSKFSFSASLFELYNEQIRDLLLESGSDRPKIGIKLPDCVVELVQEKVENPLDFSKILKVGFQNRGSNTSKFNATHLIICIHIYYENLITGENYCSKLSLIDLAGSESATIEDDTGLHATEVLYVMKSLSALGDVLNSLTSKKDNVPYGNSMLTKLFSDSLGGDSKTVLVVNLCPNALNLSETLSSLNFSARARSAVLSLGNWDTIKKWREIANDARKELYEKEKIICDMKKEIIGLTQDLKRANDQCVLLFNEVQSAWKVSYTLQSDLKAENIMLVDKHEIDKKHNSLLRSQLAELLQLEQEQKMQIKQCDSTIQTLQTKIKCLELQLNEALSSSERTLINGQESRPTMQTNFSPSGIIDSTAATRRLEEELLKRDALIERLHEENEKLFDKLTEKASLAGSPQVSSSSPKRATIENRDVGRNVTNDNNDKGHPLGGVPFPSDKPEESVALVKPCAESIKRTPAGEYLTSALNDFDPAQYDGSLAAISDGANKLLMLVLAAVIKAGASREHEILAEIRDAVFSFIRKMEPKRVMDTMLVSRVRILYIRSLLSRSPELQSIKVSPVECFLEKANTGRSRSSSRGSSPVRSPVRYNSLLDEHIQGFKVNLKPEKKSKISSVVLRIRGIDQDTWRQHVTGGKLREITEEAKSFAVGNKALAALFVHTPAGELQRQIRNWLTENFDFLSVSDDTVGGATGQLELLSTAIMDGWMAGLGAAMLPDTDALGQLLSEYVKRVFSSQLQHLKDIAGTLSTEVTVDSVQVAKLHSALESVHHKRTKILQQMRRDVALFTLDSPVRSPSTGAEDARLASLVSLDGILRQVKDISRQSRVSSLGRSRKKEMIASLDELTEHMPSLLDIDHPCAQKHIEDARRMLESIPEEDDIVNASSERSADDAVEETEVAQWNVLQFNTGLASPPFIIKCGANSSSELVIKADARVQEPKGSEIMRVVPRPTVLENMSLEEMKQLFTVLPESLSHLALARTADGTRARYSRLYRTLAMKVPALRDLISELEKGGVLKDVRS